MSRCKHGNVTYSCYSCEVDARNIDMKGFPEPPKEIYKTFTEQQLFEVKASLMKASLYRSFVRPGDPHPGEDTTEWDWINKRLNYLKLGRLLEDP